MSVYTTTEMDCELRQSEVITGLVQFNYDPVAREALETPHQYVIVISQDCDLLRDYEARASGGTLNGVLLFELETIPDIKPRLPGGDILRRIRRQSEERYHYLGEVTPSVDLLNQGLPELVIDFRRCYTMPADEIYRQCAIDTADGAKRRCRLETPYREHLQNRMAFYLSRVALPDDRPNQRVNAAAVEGAIPGP